MVVPLPIYISSSDGSRGDGSLLSTIGLPTKDESDLGGLDKRAVFCFVVVKGEMKFEPTATCAGIILTEGQALFCQLPKVNKFTCSPGSWILPILCQPDFMCDISAAGPPQVYANCHLIRVKKCGKLDRLHSDRSESETQHTYMQDFVEFLRLMRDNKCSLDSTVQLFVGNKFLPLTECCPNWQAIDLDGEVSIMTHKRLVAQLCQGEMSYTGNIKEALVSCPPRPQRHARKAMKEPRRGGPQEQQANEEDEENTDDDSDDDDDDGDDDDDDDDDEQESSPGQPENAPGGTTQHEMDTELLCHPDILLGEPEEEGAVTGKNLLSLLNFVGFLRTESQSACERPQKSIFFKIFSFEFVMSVQVNTSTSRGFRASI